MTALAYWKAKLKLRRTNLDRAKTRLVKAEKAVAYRRRLVELAEDKVDYLRKQDKTVRWALSKVGTVEHPANSNGGPGINTWQDEFHMGRGPWCGAFAGYALKQGGVKVTDRIVYTPYILQDAKAGQNGFEKTVPLTEARPGDLILMNFPGGAGVDHVGVARDKYRGGNVIATVEGNTSSGTSGSQDNGGGVFKRIRPASQIVGVARPRWTP